MRTLRRLALVLAISALVVLNPITNLFVLGPIYHWRLASMHRTATRIGLEGKRSTEVRALSGEPTSTQTDGHGKSVTWNYECPGPCLALERFQVFDD